MSVASEVDEDKRVTEDSQPVPKVITSHPTCFPRTMITETIIE